MTVSDTYKGAAYSQDTAEAVLAAVTITHADLSTPIRVIANAENVTINGDTFIAFPFDLAIPDSREDSPSRGRLVIDNVSREISEAIRSISSPPSVKIQVILGSDPDTIEHEIDGFKLRNVKWDAGKVEGDLTLEDFTAEPYPAMTFSPANAPGLF